jgi:hypothetical protein
MDLPSMVLRDEYDVIAMRQEVRQIARNLGLGLTQQAKITAAVSAVARALLGNYPTILLNAHIASQGDRQALEVAWTVQDSVVDPGQLRVVLNLNEVQLLVDDASIAHGAGGPHLTVRMWLV